MTRNELLKIIDELPNKKWKEYFTQNEFETIVNSMYKEFKKHSDIEYEFNMFLNSSLNVLSNKDGYNAIKDKYTNNDD